MPYAIKCRLECVSAEKVLPICINLYQYGGKDIENVESTIDTRLREWIAVIDRDWASLPGETWMFDIARSIQYLTTDIISHLCFGQPLEFVQNQRDMHGFLKTLESRVPIVEQFSVLTELSTTLMKLSQIARLKKAMISSVKDRQGVGKILGVSTCSTFSVSRWFLASGADM